MVNWYLGRSEFNLIGPNHLSFPFGRIQAAGSTNSLRKVKPSDNFLSNPPFVLFPLSTLMANPMTPLPVGVPLCNLRRWITISIGLSAVVGPGDLLPLPKNAVRSFFMADLGFLGNSCSHSLCCLPLVGSIFLIGVAVILSLLRAPFPSSIIEIFVVRGGDICRFSQIPCQYKSRCRPSRIEVGLPVYCLAPLEDV